MVQDNEPQKDNETSEEVATGDANLGSLRKMFPGHFRPTSEEFDSMWERGIFVLDTNVLLNLYRYSPSTRNELLKVLNAVSDRLYLPNQVGREFLDRRLATIGTQRDKFLKLRNKVKGIRQEMEAELRNVLRLQQGENLPEGLQEALEEVPAEGYLMLDARLKELESNLPRASNSPEDDEVWTAIEKLIQSKVGPPYDEKELNSIKDEAESRRNLKIPPGFRDERPGDYILWRQTIDEAKHSGKAIVLVTDDRKDDWWSIEHGETLGPRSTLVEEMRNEANVSFHMYTPDRLMREARERLNVAVSDESISEAEWVGPEPEHSIDEEIWESWAAMDEMLGRYAHRRLTDQEKYALHNSVLLGRSNSDIASELGLSRSRFRELLRRALSKMQTDDIDRNLQKPSEQLRTRSESGHANRRLDYSTKRRDGLSKEILVYVRGEEEDIVAFNRELQRTFPELESIQPSFSLRGDGAYLTLTLRVPSHIEYAERVLGSAAEEASVILEDIFPYQ